MTCAWPDCKRFAKREFVLCRSHLDAAWKDAWQFRGSRLKYVFSEDLVQQLLAVIHEFPSVHEQFAACRNFFEKTKWEALLLSQADSNISS